MGELVEEGNVSFQTYRNYLDHIGGLSFWGIWTLTMVVAFFCSVICNNMAVVGSWRRKEPDYGEWPDHPGSAFFRVLAWQLYRLQHCYRCADSFYSIHAVKEHEGTLHGIVQEAVPMFDEGTN